MLTAIETSAEPILIVDDEEAVLRLMRRILEPAGYTCVEALDAAAARELLAGGQRFALMLCDVNLPGESGIELARDVLRDYQEIAVVMISALEDPALAATALEIGAYGYLVKPFTPNVLLIDVSNALRRRTLERAARRHREELEAALDERTAELRRLAEELAASRARVVAAADETRRRLERDLHDGAQQRLVSAALAIRAAQEKAPQDMHEFGDALSDAVESVNAAMEELQEVSRGIHPAILSKGGLGPALKTLVRRLGMPVELELGAEGRWPERAEVAVYYVVSEALTNAAKHANASSIRVSLVAADATLAVVISDDGVGGADPARGSGLIGLRDRVESVGGTIELTSDAGLGTVLTASVPVGGSDLG